MMMRWIPKWSLSSLYQCLNATLSFFKEGPVLLYGGHYIQSGCVPLNQLQRSKCFSNTPLCSGQNWGRGKIIISFQNKRLAKLLLHASVGDITFPEKAPSVCVTVC